jgi:Porphyromonas-type peptidyl-arginine deiminase
MPSRIHVLLGVALGLAVAFGVLAFYRGGPDAPAPAGPLVSECDGALRRVAIHYADEADEDVVPTYRDFLRQLPAGVDVRVVCPSASAFDALVQRVGPTECQLTPVHVDHPITSWARDRWLALGPAGAGPTTLLCPRAEDGAAVWPARAGDQRVADDLAAALGPGVRAGRSDLYFDGGDFDADGETAFARPSILLRNIQRTAATREELIAALEGLLRKRVVVLEGAPDHHVGMYLMPVGDRTVLVGDPKLAEEVLARSPEEAAAVAAFLPGGSDFAAATCAHFEAVAEQCRAAGYRVARIPVVPGSDGRTYITYINAILDVRDGRRTVYMPSYTFAAGLNRAATEAWAGLGYEVKPVECDGCARNYGALHCLVNVMERD